MAHGLIQNVKYDLRIGYDMHVPTIADVVITLVVSGGIAAAAYRRSVLDARGTVLASSIGAIIGLSAGVFVTTNWALGTDLVPPEEAGRYLGVSNLAGAGAGIVGAGIGGPMADFFIAYQRGLGYLVIFAIYGALFLLSVATLLKVRPTFGDDERSRSSVPESASKQ